MLMNENDKESPPKIDKNIEAPPLRIKLVPDSLVIYLWCCVFAIILKGWRAFFVGLGLTPIVTLAELFVMALVPFMAGWIVATILLFIFKNLSFNSLWRRTTTVIFLVTLLGRCRAVSGT